MRGLVLLGVLGGLVVLSEATAIQKPQPGKLAAEEQAILDLTNAARKKEKQPPLKRNAVLARVAQAHSANMAKQDTLSHDLDGKNPSARVKAAGYVYSWVGENVGKSQGLNPPQVFEKWMESPVHQANILKKEYQELGVGLSQSGTGDWYYTQVFGAPRKKK